MLARELDTVAETLLGLHIDVFAGEALTLPWPFREARTFALSRPQPPFDSVSALSKVATHQQENAQAGMGVCMMRRKCNRAAQRDDFLEVAAVVEGRSEIGPSIGVVGLEIDGAAVGRNGFIEPARGMQRVAEIAVRFGEGWIDFDRPTLGTRRLVVLFELVECDTEVAQRRRHLRLDVERAPRFFDSKLGAPGEAIHLAEISVKERHLRCKLCGAAHMLDRLGSLPLLVRDQAEQMLGFRQIRLRLEDLSADRLRLRSAAPRSGSARRTPTLRRRV